METEKLIENVWGGRGQKWIWPLCSWDSIIGLSQEEINRVN